MIIDVIDLKLNNLQFSKKYSTARYNRGKTIYNNGYAEVKKVEKINDNEYHVKGSVNGSYYNTYNTSLEIKGNIINKCKCECEDYKGGNLCKHIIATAMEAIDPHIASTPDGKRRMRKKQEEEKKARIEALRKKQEEERKRREYLSKYRYGIDTIEQYKRNNEAEKVPKELNLAKIYEGVKKKEETKVGELLTNLKIEFILELYDEETLSLNLKVGKTRMYVLNNISEFYNAYKEEKEIYYGKQLRFIPKRENFCENSRWMFDYIIQYGEMLDYYNSLDKYSSISDKQLLIRGEKIDKFFDILPDKKVMFHCYEGSRKTSNELCEITNEDIDISCKLKKEKVRTYQYYWNYYEEEQPEETEEYVLRMNISNFLVFFSDKKIYILYKAKIYIKKKEEKLQKIFNLFRREDYILIPEDRLEEFNEFVMPQMLIKREDLPIEFAKNVEIVQELASKMLLDTDDNGNILLELKFCYENKEFNILEKNYETYVVENKIVRNIPAEAEVIKRLFFDGFEYVRGKKEFIMKNTDNIYSFLLNKIEGYMNDFEVLATDRFKNKQIRQPKISNVGIRIDNGLLELDISKINIDMDEIKDILKDYNIKKKYHKLKNGDFLDLTNSDDLNLLDEMGTTLDIDYSKMKNGIINLPISRSFYLEKLIDTNKEISVAKNSEFVELIDSVKNTELSKKIKIDKSLESKLRDYQKVGYKWLKTLEMYKLGGILADDMGLGKTLQVISVLRAEAKSKVHTTSIVVCPSTLVLNWKSEVEKWCNTMKVLVLSGKIEDRREKLERYQEYDLVITSYDLLKRDTDNYEDKKFKYIIADEAQYIKNSLTQNATSLKSLQGEVKFALTGTPIENSVAELWSIFDFIMPGYLYNYNKFKKKFEEPIIKNEDIEALIRLKKLISPFILRRVKKDVLTELPEKNITIMKNEMEKEQEKIYLSYLAQTKKEIAEELSDSSFEKSKFKILMLLTRLRQICCHPSLFIENYKGGSGKLNQCLDLLSDTIESGHKILLFSSYTSMFEIIEKELEKKEIKYFKLVGNTPVNKRIEMVDEFNDNEDIKVFLISLKAGGTGLNLTSADVVIHYDPWWNVSSENQATDRAYRIGQKNSVQVYKLITGNSIEEKINKMQERKEKLSKDVLSTEETFISKMTKEEILDLFE